MEMASKGRCKKREKAQEEGKGKKSDLLGI